MATFEFGVAVEVFGLPRPELDPWYTFSVCSVDENPLRATGGFTLTVDKGLGALRSAGTIIVPGWRDVGERPPEALTRALGRAHERGARLVSLCSGAFVLAATGLLDGRRAATHWRYASELSRRYPAIEVDSSVLYVDDGRLLTAAGSAAAIDLCLHLVRRDFGARVAAKVARRLVVSPHREGGQAQFVDTPMGPDSGDDIAELMDWLRSRLKDEHRIESLAKHLHVSERTLARRFHQRTGTTPMRWLARERVRHAQLLLESTNLGVEDIARECGLGSAQLLRFHFHRAVGTTPTAYRTAFCGARSPGSASR